MNSALQRIQARRSLKKEHRERRSLEKWEQIRAVGKARFVRRHALTYGFTVAGVTDLLNRAVDGESDSILFKLIFFLIAGIVIGSMTWSGMEAKREDALRRANAKPLADNQTLPQSGQGVSKA